MTRLETAERPLFETNVSDKAEGSSTLPSRWYWDPAVFALEKKRIFSRSWWYVGAEAELGDPGRYVTTAVVDQDVLVMRGQDGALHGKGYRGAEARPIRIEAILGLVFVNLDPDARPLSETAAGMLADMRAHCPGLDSLVLTRCHEKETAANWKALVDNNLESYHVAPAHPALTELLDYRSFRVWEYDFATCHSMANSNPENAAYKVGDNAAVKTALYTWLWPNTAFFIAPGRRNLAVFQMVPTGPETSRQRWDFFFADRRLDDDEQSSLDYTIETLIPEDTALYENVQRGLRSRSYDEGRLVINYDRPELSEHHVHMFQKLVRDALIPERLRR